MKKYTHIYLSLLSLLLFIGVCIPIQQTKAASKDVVLIGSSSFALGCSKSYGFIKVLEKDIGDIFDCSYAKSGATYNGFETQWNNAKSSGNKYTMLFYYAGWNSMSSQAAFDGYQNAMKTIIDEAKTAGIKVVGVSAQPSSNATKNAFIDKNNATLQSLSDIYIPFGESIDTDGDNTIDAKYLSSDKIHANALGNKILADLISKQVFHAGAAVLKVDTGVPFINEIDLILEKPSIKISIPGVSFTDQDDLIRVEDSDDDSYIYFPFLGEYISGVYKYLIAAAGVMAVVMIMIAGFRIIVSGGNSEQINAAKTNIMRSVIGLTIMALSYTILYAVNPDLVNFRNLRVLLIQGESVPVAEESEEGSIDYGDTSSLKPECQVTPPAWGNATFDCDKWRAGGYEPEGVVPTSCVLKYKCPGIITSITTVPEMKDAICKVGQLALDQGYKIAIGKTSYRSFEKQAENWCTSKYKNVNVRDNFIAVPGKSNHGLGIAVDAYLYLSDGTPLMSGVKSNTQCAVKLEHVDALAKLFYDADARFERLSTEIWHFNFRIGGAKESKRIFGYPAGAGCK